MPIIITGFMGVGKTTVGRILAKDLNVPFVDMDIYIVEQEKKTIPEIFASVGEAGFREIECRVLNDLLDNPVYENAVVSTGGGIVETAAAREILSEQKFVVYLQDSFETSWYRINRQKAQTNDRPLVSANTRDQMAEKYQRRIPLYMESSKIMIDVRDLEAHHTAKEIQAYL